MFVALASVTILVAAAIALTWLSNSAPRAPETCYGADADFLDNFSLRSYRPMIRLAARLDRDFLVQIHGPRLADCYRGIQRQVLREYLKTVSKDYNRLYAIANARSTRAASDTGDLSMALFEQQMSFIFLMWGIEARLLLEPILPGPIDLNPLVRYVENMAQQTRALSRPQLSYRAV